MSRLLSPLLMGLLISCSILEDTDITSVDELEDLKLKSIQITETLNGNAITNTATVMEEVINDPLRPSLTKRVTISWPSFTNPKFQFRSGVTSNISIVSEYFTDGRIKFWRVKSSGIEKETYEFVYGNGVLYALQTTIIANLDTTLYKDIYSSADSYNFPTERISFTKAHPKGETIAVFGSNESFATPCSYKFVWQYGTCEPTSPSTCKWTEKKQYNYCDGSNFYILNKDNTEGARTQFSALSTGQQLQEVYFGETQDTGSCCGDKYYFHPYLFMAGDFRLKILYAADWWKDDINFTGISNQSVRIKFQNGY